MLIVGKLRQAHVAAGKVILFAADNMASATQYSLI
jgi:hypothetical protein